ncbi:alpha/beta fold hydrolase [Leucobacter sp. CSA2]|uniref:Alpha/beta fold hydrolase n=1 Tax=Leucobacter edaphi TaxID=2796472 RepID=A0A934QAU4_9MICO|nr:alpha/beta fold hydrolase [Leucobacter edaphi]MBK0421151.1 alpha/beta fold hydrolase [Leucobacter edaphi]
MSHTVGDWYQVGQDMLARDLWTEVPRDWSHPEGERIRVFAREFIDPAKRDATLEELPAIVYLQGGPGGKGARPLGRTPFLDAALKRFRVVYPDQRGTGRSTPVSAAEFAPLSGEEAADRLALYRSDSIVRDFEELRRVHFGGRPWWTIGQSYGGFITLNYLSLAPEAIVASAVTGGLPSIDPDPETVYERTFPRARRKNEEFFARFPHLQARVDRIADLLAAEDIRLPGGDRLTVRRFQSLGFDFGMAVGFDRVHWILDEAFADAEETRLSDAFLVFMEHATSHADAPLYIALQEAIYGPGPSEWAAQRVLERNPDFAEDARPLRFTGEMAFPWMVDEITALRPYAAGVHALHAGARPLDLYDTERLAANTVPVEAAVYFDDLYVDAQLSLDTESRVGGLHAWVTNEYEHDGIHQGDVAERLFRALELRIALENGTDSSR